ncbi:MAG: hypothetical protein A2075_18955 [Geobacteraceae bacterium GWC2_58_44]|nr:MAG: hypothetical protein A2075_18955 [Geobacteraceae bacterium GWC2_58_44]
MVCAYLFMVIERPWESIKYLDGIPVERVFAIAMIVVAIMHNKLKLVSSPTNKWVLGLLLIHFALAPFAYSTEYAFSQGIEYLKMVVLYLLMLSLVDDESGLKLFIKTYIFTMMFYVLHSLREYHNGRHVWRMGISRMVGADSTLNDPNAFGASVVLSLPFVYALLRSETSSRLRKLYYCYISLAVICVVLTGSRSSFVGLLFLFLLWGMVQHGKRKLVILTVAISAVIAIWSVMPDEKQERIRTLWDEEAGPANAHSSAQGRLVGLKVSWEMFKRAPITGVGAGGKNYIGYRMANKIDEEGHESPTQAHILYGEVLAELGAFGAFLLAGLVWAIWSCSRYARSRLLQAGLSAGFSYAAGGAIIASLLLLLLLGVGGHNFYRPLWLWLAAWSGSLFRITNQLNPRWRSSE